MHSYQLFAFWARNVAVLLRPLNYTAYFQIIGNFLGYVTLSKARKKQSEKEQNILKISTPITET